MNVILGVWDLGMGQIILILLVVLLMFGAKKLPDLAKGLGQGIKEFKKATRDIQDEVSKAANAPDEVSRPTPPEPPKSASSESQKPEPPSA
ncbi:MAG: twin-arginine translocase TatA/TatE family subunit [Verrucomicrobia bacterium]|nr:twin-arginine translocase TatA/TatE family subunit [Verrucomicrobiota bacterium]